MTARSNLSVSRADSPIARITYFWQHGDRLYRFLLRSAVLLVLLLVVAIGFELWQNSALSRQAFGWKFIVTN